MVCNLWIARIFTNYTNLIIRVISCNQCNFSKISFSISSSCHLFSISGMAMICCMMASCFCPFTNASLYLICGLNVTWLYKRYPFIGIFFAECGFNFLSVIKILDRQPYLSSPQNYLMPGRRSHRRRVFLSSDIHRRIFVQSSSCLSIKLFKTEQSSKPQFIPCPKKGTMAWAASPMNANLSSLIQGKHFTVTKEAVGLLKKSSSNVGINGSASVKVCLKKAVTFSFVSRVSKLRLRLQKEKIRYR